MSAFITNILARHVHPENNIKPRLRSRFEPVDAFFSGFNTTGELEQETFVQAAGTPLQPVEKSRTGILPASVSPLTVSEYPEVPRDHHQIESIPILDPKSPDKVYEQSDRSNTTSKRISVPSNGSPESPAPPKWPEVVPSVKSIASHKRTPRKTQDEEALTSEDISDSRSLVRKVRPKTIQSDREELQPKTPTPVKTGKDLPVHSEDNYREQIPITFGGESSLARTFDLPTNIQAEKTPSSLIRVTIGRIEVRASGSPTSTPRKRSTPTKPRMSLEDFLKKQNANSR